jgi:SAM-dependent methyltransferase
VTGVLFADRRLAEIYDALHRDRSDLDPYLARVAELSPTSVLDLGCGTGTFALQLAALGKEVIGVDPAAASIEVARRKDEAGRVRWIVGDATSLPDVEVDLVTMTGNVGEHLSDTAWSSALVACRKVLRPEGHLLFGARDPAGRPWSQWNESSTFERVEIAGVGVVRDWLEVTDEGPHHFTFRWTFVFERDGTTIEWNATFRVRTRGEITDALTVAGFEIVSFDEPNFLFTARRAE